jgi:hypothetical protein
MKLITLCLALALSGFACHKDKAPKKTDEPAVSPSGRSWPSDAPPRDKCERDEDCRPLASGPGGPDPCCDVTVKAMIFGREFLEYTFAYRAEHCTGVSCPPLEKHGPPAATCAYLATCVEGRCQDTCGGQ